MDEKQVTRDEARATSHGPRVTPKESLPISSPAVSYGASRLPTGQASDELNDYLESKAAKGYTRDGLCGIEGTLKQFLRFIQNRGKQNIHEISPEDIEGYRTYLITVYRKKDGNPLSRVTVIDKLLTVKRFFDWLQRENIIFIDPAKRIELPKRTEVLPKTVLNEDQIMRLIEQPDTTKVTGLRDRTILEALYSTGIRRRELINLNVNDIDIQKGILRIIQGKGKKDRFVPIGRLACKFVSEYIRTSRPWLKGRNQTEALFIKEGGERLTGHAVRAIIKRSAEKARINDNITVHGIRHTCATHLLKGGADLRHVQAILGHARLSTTEVYTRVVSEDLKDVIKTCHPREKLKPKTA